MTTTYFNNERKENKIIFAICVIAMVRVFVFSAAFPLFNPVDEFAHCDTVVKYANGYFPHLNENISIDRWYAKMLAIYDSPEYFDKVPNKVKPFFLLTDSYTNSVVFDRADRYVNNLQNHEVHSPPVYYYLAGMWFNIGKAIGIGGVFLLYWIKFLNVFIYGVTIWFAYLFLRKIYYGDNAFCIGVPMMLAVFPNDLFYSITNDVISPLLVNISLLIMYKIFFEKKCLLFYSLSGIAVSAAILTKLTNIAIILVFAILLTVGLFRSILNKQPIVNAGHFALFLGAVVLPVFLWMGWNMYALGDLTGDTYKMAVLGWSRKPFPEWINHPIFSISGLTGTVANFHMLVSTFWRGEVIGWMGESGWMGKSKLFTPMENFYFYSSLLFIFSATVKLLTVKTKSLATSFPQISGLLLIASYIIVLVILSIQFDFGTCHAPSRRNPYLNKGRLIIGCLVPFMILYVDGLVFMMKKIRLNINPLYVITFISILIFYCSIVLNFNKFGSQWNWFHIV